MKHKLELLIRDLEKTTEFYRQQQKLSRDPKKQYFWLGHAESSVKTIGLLKRTFHKELTLDN